MLQDLLGIGQEFLRWEIATATAGRILGINPFDQPNVQESKDSTNRLLLTVKERGRLPESRPIAREGLLHFYSPETAISGRELLGRFLATAHRHDYVALQAYLTETRAVTELLQGMRKTLREGTGLATTLGYGPRFLHSTGQFHKGGPNIGLFLQLTADNPRDAAIPNTGYTFGIFKQAQAMGDMESLLRHGRRIIRIHLGADIEKGSRSSMNCSRYPCRRGSGLNEALPRRKLGLAGCFTIPNVRGDAMTRSASWAIGVDLGGTKIAVAKVGLEGFLEKRLLIETNVKGGPPAVIADIVRAVRHFQETAESPPAGVGVGVAGQIDEKSGLVRFAPNLGWRDEPFGQNLSKELGLPVTVINDVRAAAWGEWRHGAGRGCSDLVCLFVGTGIGGGVVSGGRMLTGCSNTAGELGHMTIDRHGPPCHCRNHGCLEALASGWAIAGRARDDIRHDPSAGAHLLAEAGGEIEAVTAKTVAQGARAGDLLARRLMDDVASALIAGAVIIVNAFNPCRLILGGGVIEGTPELVARIDEGVRRRALSAALSKLEVLAAQLHNDAGVIGTAACVFQSLAP